MPPAAPRRGTSLVLAVLGGLLTDAASPGLSWWPLAYVGIALLVLALGRDSARWNVLVGFVFGLAFFVPQLTWAGVAVGVVPWIGLAALQAGFVAALGGVWTLARRGPVPASTGWQVVAFALLWVGVEEARSVLPFGGFPWGRIAFSQADAPLAAWAWLGGAPLVSGLVVVVGALLAAAVRHARRDPRSSLLAVLVGVAVVAGGLVVPLDTAAQAGTLEVGAVQGNVPDRGLDSFNQAREVLDNHVAGTWALLDQVAPGELDLVLWPENGADIDPRVDAAAAADITAAAQGVGAPILVGTLEYPPSGGRYNVSVLWDPELGPVDVYAKQHPAPFGEYIPLRDLARLVSPEVDRVRTDMLPGTEVGLIEMDSARLGRTVGIGDVICFEVAYDDLVRDAVAAGGEILVVQTNNATFGPTDESLQQLAMSRLRAIEHGRATVQISTVGVSAVISPSGQVLAQTELFTAEQMVESLPLRTALTPASRWGDLVSWTLRVAALALTLVAVVRGTSLRRRSRAARQVARADVS
ncbi:MAG TPA: apolipoprotein N-acyltransferase [Actinotalea sp.]|nr:apolipoprotein N-acyltransferase [Actinotalea sp.]